jgi:hypothetical protein
MKVKRETLPLLLDDSIEKVKELLLQLSREIEYHGIEEVYNSQMGHFHFWLFEVSVEKLHAGLVERAIKSNRLKLKLSQKKIVWIYSRRSNFLGFRISKKFWSSMKRNHKRLSTLKKVFWQMPPLM